MNLGDFLVHHHSLKRFQFDQLYSLSQYDDDPDSYNMDHLRDMVDALVHANGWSELDFSEEIAFAKVMLHDNK